MAHERLTEPTSITPDSIDPHHRWDRPLQAPGHMQVDFEERIDFRRLHRYRLSRVRQALAQSGFGALLCFDQHNIRYTTSTVIGEWARGEEKQRHFCAVLKRHGSLVWPHALDYARPSSTGKLRPCKKSPAMPHQRRATVVYRLR